MRSLIHLGLICLLVATGTSVSAILQVNERSLVNASDCKNYDNGGIRIKFTISRKGYWAAYVKKVEPNKVCVVFNGKPGKSYDKIRGYYTAVDFWQLDSLVSSPDGKHIAYQAFRDGQWFICKDGIEGKPYIEVTPPIFCDNGEGMIYKAQSGDKWVVVYNGKESMLYDEIGTISISPDGERYAFKACNNEEGQKNKLISTVIDGVPLPVRKGKLDDLIQFSTDSKRVMTIVGDTEENINPSNSYIIIDGQVSKGYPKISSPHFTPDGSHYYYIWSSEFVPFGKNYAFLVWDNHEYEINITKGDSIICSEDGQHFLYEDNGLIKDGNQVIMPQGKIPHYLSCGLPVWKFSSDAEHYYCVIASGDKKVSVVFDGVKGSDYPGSADCAISNVQMSRDGKHYAYTAFRGNKCRVVYDGKEEKRLFDSISNLTLSPDGQRFAYIGKIDNRFTMVVDDTSSAFIEGEFGKPCFSPDSKTIAYKMVLKNGLSTLNTRIIINAISGKIYGHTTDPTFTADSRHIAYFAELPNMGKTTCVVDGEETPIYDTVLTIDWQPIPAYIRYSGAWYTTEFSSNCIQQPVMDSNNSLHFFAKKNNVFMVVTVTLSAQLVGDKDCRVIVGVTPSLMNNNSWGYLLIGLLVVPFLIFRSIRYVDKESREKYQKAMRPIVR